MKNNEKRRKLVLKNTNNTLEMNEKKKTVKKNVELNTIEEEKKKRKEEFDSILEKIKKMSEAVELHTNVKQAVSKEEVDNNYLKYIENSLEDKLFNDAKFGELKSKVLLEVVCPDLTNIENFEIDKLEIADIGSHFEEETNYIDKVCTYDNKFVCLFGISELDADKVIKYESRKFSRADMIEAICEKLEHGKTMQMEQYDEYYVVSNEEGMKIFSERKVTALMKVEENVFDKIKSKLTSLFTKSLFGKKKYLPSIELIYDTNQNRFKNFEHKTSKVDAKNRMKALLLKEREVTRSTN